MTNFTDEQLVRLLELDLELIGIPLGERTLSIEELNKSMVPSDEERENIAREIRAMGKFEMNGYTKSKRYNDQWFDIEAIISSSKDFDTVDDLIAFLGTQDPNDEVVRFVRQMALAYRVSQQLAASGQISDEDMTFVFDIAPMPHDVVEAGKRLNLVRKVALGAVSQEGKIEFVKEVYTQTKDFIENFPITRDDINNARELFAKTKKALSVSNKIRNAVLVYAGYDQSDDGKRKYAENSLQLRRELSKTIFNYSSEQLRKSQRTREEVLRDAALFRERKWKPIYTAGRISDSIKLELRKLVKSSVKHSLAGKEMPIFYDKLDAMRYFRWKLPSLIANQSVNLFSNVEQHVAQSAMRILQKSEQKGFVSAAYEVLQEKILKAKDPSFYISQLNRYANNNLSLTDIDLSTKNGIKKALSAAKQIVVSSSREAKADFFLNSIEGNIYIRNKLRKYTNMQSPKTVVEMARLIQHVGEVMVHPRKRAAFFKSSYVDLVNATSRFHQSENFTFVRDEVSKMFNNYINQGKWREIPAAYEGRVKNIIQDLILKSSKHPSIEGLLSFDDLMFLKRIQLQSAIMNLPQAVSSKISTESFFKLAEGTWERIYQNTKYRKNVFRINFVQEVSKVLNQETNVLHFKSNVRGVIRSNMSSAFRAGLFNLGIDEELHGNFNKVERFIITQLTKRSDAFIEDMYTRINRGAFSILKELKVDSLWYNKLVDKAFQFGRLSADRNGLYEWVLGSGEHSCPSCTRAAGQKHRLRDWYVKKLLPRSSTLVCGGFQCKCELVRATGGSRGRFDRIPVYESPKGLITW